MNQSWPGTVQKTVNTYALQGTKTKGRKTILVVVFQVWCPRLNNTILRKHLGHSVTQQLNHHITIRLVQPTTIKFRFEWNEPPMCIFDWENIQISGGDLLENSCQVDRKVDGWNSIPIAALVLTFRNLASHI
jgi:hypothetical protein